MAKGSPFLWISTGNINGPDRVRPFSPIDILRRNAILRRKYGRRTELRTWFTDLRERAGNVLPGMADRTIRAVNRQEVFQMITIIQGVPVMIGEGTGNISVIDVLDRK